jgi:diadenosine tetraphosphate (Ap4A) HIT family hydrolase
MNETIRKFGYPGTLIREYDHWVVLLRPAQVTLGSLILACKEPVQQFHAVSAAGFAEQKRVVTDIEQALGEMVDYAKINYLMLMMVDPDVHYHVIPRYEQALTFEGLSFPDHGWPGPPALGQSTATDDAQNGAIIARLKQLWPAG